MIPSARVVHGTPFSKLQNDFISPAKERRSSEIGEPRRPGLALVAGTTQYESAELHRHFFLARRPSAAQEERQKRGETFETRNRHRTRCHPPSLFTLWHVEYGRILSIYPAFRLRPGWHAGCSEMATTELALESDRLAKTLGNELQGPALPNIAIYSP
jgi:hypothetical protein